MSGPCLSASGAGRALTPARHLRLGRPLPYQLANTTWPAPQAEGHLTATNPLTDEPCGPPVSPGISPSFPGLSRSWGYVSQALLPRSPLDSTELPQWASLDLHALSTPPTFALSQDQTLHKKWLPSAKDRSANPHTDGFAAGLRPLPVRWVCYRHQGLTASRETRRTVPAMLRLASKPARLCVAPRQRTHPNGGSLRTLPDCQRALLPASGSGRLTPASSVALRSPATIAGVHRQQVIYAAFSRRQGGNRKFFAPGTPLGRPYISSVATLPLNQFFPWATLLTQDHTPTAKL